MNELEKILDKIEKTSKKVVGEPIEIDERTLIPIIQINSFSNSIEMRKSSGKPKFLGYNITPIAIVLVDHKKRAVLPIQNIEISLNKIIEEIPDLSDKIKEAG